jgi:hypothetical protein
MKWLNEHLDACTPSDDADLVWGCMDDGAVDACGDWVGTIDSDNAYYVECVEDMRYLVSEVLADEGVEGDALRAYRQEVETRLPSGMTVRDYAATVFDPEPMTWVRKQRKTCAASRVILSVENCMSESAIQVCASGNWFGGIDPENSEYTDCVEDMQYLASKTLKGARKGAMSGTSGGFSRRSRRPLPGAGGSCERRQGAPPPSFLQKRCFRPERVHARLFLVERP